MVLAAVVKGGKTQKNGKVGYLGCIRHKDPIRCAQGALARWAARRFTIDKVLCFFWQTSIKQSFST